MSEVPVLEGIEKEEFVDIYIFENFRVHTGNSLEACGEKKARRFCSVIGDVRYEAFGTFAIRNFLDHVIYNQGVSGTRHNYRATRVNDFLDGGIVYRRNRKTDRESSSRTNRTE